MEVEFRPTDRLCGELRVPGDKSISHRAAILASIASGRTTVLGFLDGLDCLATVTCFRALGVEIKTFRTESGMNLEIYGCGIDGLKEADDILYCGNSGTLIRLLTGLLSGQTFYSVLTGDESIKNRPMKRVVEPLSRMGAHILGRANSSLAPLTIDGQRLCGISYTMPVASAQVKSSILLAALSAEGNTEIIEPVSSRDHTERMLKSFGADISVQSNANTGSKVIVLKPGTPLFSQEVRIPGDISSAAYLIVAGLLVPNSHIIIKNVGINPLRTGLVDALQLMGAELQVIPHSIWCGEPVGDIIVTSSTLYGAVIKDDIIPRLIDEIPVLALAAACAEGKTVIQGASELRIKESDRIRTVVTQLNCLGASIEELTDGMIISGTSKLAGGVMDACGDHRIALMGAVAGLISENGVKVVGFDCAEVSYPGFLDDVSSIAR
jgi:3-phosphoshikimate 1-carboxyvinyltransferase